MKITVKQITQTALLLALCILSQYFKNLSVYITGPIINAILIIATLSIGLFAGITISVIAPITAFFLTGSPIMAAIPLMFPVIMLGNIVIVLCSYFFEKRTSFKGHLPVGLVVGSIAKAAFLGILVVLVLLPLFGSNVASHLPKPEALPKVLASAKVMFSITQLITALTGSLLAWLIWLRLERVVKKEEI